MLHDTLRTKFRDSLIGRASYFDKIQAVIDASKAPINKSLSNIVAYPLFESAIALANIERPLSGYALTSLFRTLQPAQSAFPRLYPHVAKLLAPPKPEPLYISFGLHLERFVVEAAPLSNITDFVSSVIYGFRTILRGHLSVATSPRGAESRSAVKSFLLFMEGNPRANPPPRISRADFTSPARAKSSPTSLACALPPATSVARPIEGLSGGARCCTRASRSTLRVSVKSAF